MENLTRRSLLIGMSTVALANSVPAFGVSQEEAIVFIGGYTDKNSKSLGIYAYRLNAKTGELTALGLAAATPNPSFLAISANRTLLYAANEIDSYNGAKDGSVSAFSVDRQGGAATGKLTLLNVVSSGGAGPCNINLDHTGECVLVANYDGGTAATFRTLDGGKVEDIHYAGHGPNAERQATPHAHCATASPDNRHVLINDLGLDCIHVYSFDAKTAKLTPNRPASYQATPDSGPRSLVFHPNGRFAYSTNELSNTVDVLAWDAAAGKLTRVQNLPTAANPGDTRNTVASFVLDRDGKNLYVSNRGPENSIAQFRVDHFGGELTFVGRVDSGGQTPRHLAIDRGDRWLIVANQDSNSLVVFERQVFLVGHDRPGDRIEGRLVPTGRSYPIDSPTCVLFG
jgi:6-phosphogluconolactonase